MTAKEKTIIQEWENSILKDAGHYLKELKQFFYARGGSSAETNTVRTPEFYLTYFMGTDAERSALTLYALHYAQQGQIAASATLTSKLEKSA